MRKSMLVVAAAAIASAQVAAAADATAQLDMYSAYVWRGITLNQDPVAQPSLDVKTASGFGLYVWGNMDLGNADGARQKGEFSETDLIAYYSFTTGQVTVTIGYIEYLFPHQSVTDDEGTTTAAPGTREVYAGMDVGLGMGFNGSAYVYSDVDEADGYYGSLGLTYGRDLIENKLSCQAGGSIGCADKDWAAYNSGGTQGGWHEYTLSAGLTYNATEKTKVGAKVFYTDSMNEDVLPDQIEHWYGCLSAVFTL
jgi:hypothetical protein